MPNPHDAAAERRERVIAQMEKSQRDFLVASSPAAVAYLTDVDIRPFSGRGAAVVLRDDGDMTLLASEADRGFVEGSGFAGRVKTWAIGENARANRDDLVREESRTGGTGPLSRGAVETRNADSYRHLLADTRPPSLLTEAERLLDAAALVKDDDELRRLRQAADLADIGYTAVVDRMHPELRVLEIVRNVDRSLRAAGGGGWWSPLEDHAVTADSLYPHSSIMTLLGRGRESGVLDPVEPLPFALYPLSEVYAGAVGTTVVLTPPSERLRSRAALLTEALHAAVAAIRPGVSGGEVHAAFAAALGDDVDGHVANQVVGYSIGTGAGRPLLTAGSRDVLPPGSVVTVRGSLPGDSAAPVAYQTTVVVTETGNDVLNIVPMRLIELY